MEDQAIFQFEIIVVIFSILQCRNKTLILFLPFFLGVFIVRLCIRKITNKLSIDCFFLNFMDRLTNASHFTITMKQFEERANLVSVIVFKVSKYQPYHGDGLIQKIQSQLMSIEFAGLKFGLKGFLVNCRMKFRYRHSLAVSKGSESRNPRVIYIIHSLPQNDLVLADKTEMK